MKDQSTSPQPERSVFEALIFWKDEPDEERKS